MNVSQNEITFKLYLYPLSTIVLSKKIDYPTQEEISRINSAIKSKDKDYLLKVIEDHSPKYIYNLKLDKNNNLSLFHKLILLDLTSIFIFLCDKLSEKFRLKSSLREGSDSSNSRDQGRNSHNNNSKALSLDEKSTYDNEENPLIKYKEKEITLNDILTLKDKSGNTPMLFAAFRGNLTAMKKMIELGIGYCDLNNAGLNIIHMAAQSDSPQIIVYFKEKYNFDLFQNDYLKNNALHWACSSGSKAVFDYLMLYINKELGNEEIINSVNNQGQSALHITVLTSGSISTIKKLIKKGIDINIKDRNGLTVNDLVKNKKKYENIEKVISDYTDKSCLGLNHHINDDLNKYFKYIFFIILSLFILSSIIFIFIPYLKFTQYISTSEEYLFYFSTILFLSFFIYITFSNPGIIQKNELESWIDIIESGKKIEKMCPYCKVELNKFSKHCFLCNKCIEAYDHHCHWINNCVGNGNKSFFIAFIFFLWLNLVFDCYISFLLFMDGYTRNSGNYFLENKLVKNIYGGIIFLVSLFFIFPVSYLIYMQYKNKDAQKEVQTYLKEVKELNLDLDDKNERLLLDNNDI